MMSSLTPTTAHSHLPERLAPENIALLDVAGRLQRLLGSIKPAPPEGLTLGRVFKMHFSLNSMACWHVYFAASDEKILSVLPLGSALEWIKN